ncbi:ATP-binding protein [Tenacibaculum maritimum]|uniref:sensor histidine kinase n=1 Tax=Tenacibaculum maritimum TaxID=107401 RepID=UPI0012E5C712|nr:ATP-binding protein [Tenacibaculum maritimum]CAA0143694.1 membrane hypothetical protein [Tenacibaculum maritimum]CAA0143982.1 membrane hypothetical protein [Tenacibaculum maritimum]CAA0144523.1 membrane hypothetical protein [Tenacibaculum maritimum]CAA0157235.1 membrane hypothetical protein [Tenacibaculum maritimum]CAA0203888.1 membrane hypothetical protein [Tenacibaculum maritimum]
MKENMRLNIDNKKYFKFFLRGLSVEILPYLIGMICIFGVFAFECFDEYSKEFLQIRREYKDRIHDVTLALGKVKKYAEGTSVMEEYKLRKKLKEAIKKKYFKKKSEESFLGFRSFHLFMGQFGTWFSLLVYSSFMLFKSFQVDQKNIGMRVLHSLMIFTSLFYLGWVFHSNQDYSRETYYLIGILSAIVMVITIFLISKYRKTTIQRLEKVNREAGIIIKKLEKEVLTKQEKEREEERQRISEELHDGILGKLFGTRMKLGFIDVSSDQNKERYQSFLKELQEIEKEIREVSHKLSTNLDGSNIDFIGIVEQLLKDKSTLNKFDYALSINDDINWFSIEEVSKLNLYRIIQEALQNIIKHAKASKVIIKIVNIEGNLRVEIEDDGIGIERVNAEKGIGIKNIKLRVKRLRGVVDINSNSKGGTTLKVEFPYN